MTQLDRAAETVRPRSPLPLILGLVAVAIAVVVLFASSRRSDVPDPAGPLPAPVPEDSVTPEDSVPVAARESAPGDQPVQRAPADRPVPQPDPAPRPDQDTADSVRPPIGDPAALPRPPVTLPRPERDSAGDRP